jgi:SAV_6107-like HEPN
MTELVHPMTEEIPMSHAATTLDLLDRAREAVTSGYAAPSAPARYLAASLGALRAGAALVAARSATHPGAGLASGGDGPHDVWALTARVAPELTEWAQRFAAATGQRVGVETGLVRVSAREADDLLRDAETFVDLTAGRLGVPSVHRPRRLVPVRSA